MKQEEWQGSWWRSTGGPAAGGQLAIDETGITLTVFGSLADWSGVDLTKGVGFPVSEPQRIAVFHGLASRPLSVLGAESYFPLFPGARGSENWHADAIVEGHVELDAGVGDVLFEAVRFEMEALPSWARARGVRVRRTLDSRQTDVSVRPHELARGRLSTGTDFLVEQASVTSHGHLEFNIRQPVTISFTPPAPSSWQDLLNQWLQPTQVLLWLATGSVRRINRVELTAADEDRSRGWRQLWVPLVGPRESERPERDLHRSDVLFFLDELPGGPALGLDRWFALWAELRHVLGPLYARANSPFAYANDRFYTAAAAIEAYHRYCVTSERDLPRVEHRARVARVDALMNEHAPDIAQWAVNAVTPFNRVAFAQRIRMICETLEEISATLVGSHLELFTNVVEDARHGHAHALEREAPWLDGEVLYRLADALTWLLRACVMIDLGLRPDVVSDRLHSNDRFRRAAEGTREVLGQLSAGGGATTPPA